MKLLVIILTIFFFSNLQGKELEKCKWKNIEGTPCLTIFSTPNTSKITEGSVNKIVITKKQMIESGYHDVRSLLEQIAGIDVYSDGPRGQKTSVFMRGTNSNHTLVLLNGVAINDQSTTQGLHNFGQDFVQTLQQIEIYKGPNGAHFGPSAIGGAINLITDVDYQNNLNVNGYNFLNN